MHLKLTGLFAKSIVDYKPDNLAGGDFGDVVIGPARRAVVPWIGIVVTETQAALADCDHCREIAGKLRELAHYTRLPGIRRELADLAQRYDRRGDHLARCSGY